MRLPEPPAIVSSSALFRLCQKGGVPIFGYFLRPNVVCLAKDSLHTRELVVLHKLWLILTTLIPNVDSVPVHRVIPKQSRSTGHVLAHCKKSEGIVVLLTFARIVLQLPT